MHMCLRVVALPGEGIDMSGLQPGFPRQSEDRTRPTYPDILLLLRILLLFLLLVVVVVYVFMYALL